MPELPEVETIVRGLNINITGKTIISCIVYDKRPLRNCTTGEFEDFVKNETIRSIKRFGKYLHFTFKSGKSLVSHLRMTGKYIVDYNNGPTIEQMKYVRIVFTLSDDSRLLFKDVRLFGTVSIYRKDDPVSEKEKVGIEPLSRSFTADYLYTVAQKRVLSIKQFLLDQKVIAGLGNIYVCESLFLAGLNPEISASAITYAQAEALVVSIKKVLKKAIRYNGTSIRDFRNIDDKSGRFQKMLRVYQKEDELCSVCQIGVIRRIKQGQRSTFFCPVCQKRY